MLRVLSTPCEQIPKPRPGQGHGALIHRWFTAEGDPLALASWGPRSVLLAARQAPDAGACVQIDAPSSWSSAAVATVARRYLGRLPDGSPERSLRALIERVVHTIGAWAHASGHVVSPLERATLEAELAAVVLTQRATFATPVWLNVGLEEHPFTSACFILEAEDSIRSLLDWNAREGMIFQQGGGTGINLSKVRSSREPVSRGGLASGPVSFMRATDAWAATIRSGGRARRGAKMVVLNADHPDVLEFIACKAREEEHGAALVAAGYRPEEVVRSLAFQNATHAVWVSDEFMQAAADDGAWPLHAVTTGEVIETISARELLRACAQAAWRCGDPGLHFSGAIESWHTCPRSGPITASNPCGEFLHVGESACNLATLNLLAFIRDDGSFETDAFTNAVELVVLAQDAIVEGSAYPTERIARGARRFRPIGLGYSNLAAVLLTLGIAYDSEEGRAWAAAITALLTGAAYRRSARLAAVLGPFEEFERNREPMLAVLARHRDAAGQIGSEAPAEVLAAAQQIWKDVLADAPTHGLRNAQTTLIPPTGTVSLMLDCESTGIEPYYALNLVPETSPETLESSFFAAWRLGLKSISVYREGSKLGQPLQAADE